MESNFEFIAIGKTMRRLTTRELLYLQDMCLEADLRCLQRAATARIEGDNLAAAREAELEERYRNLRAAILDDLYVRGNHDPMGASLLQVRAGMKEELPEASNDARIGAPSKSGALRTA